jgi:hypothetical protein
MTTIVFLECKFSHCCCKANVSGLKEDCLEISSQKCDLHKLKMPIYTLTTLPAD